MQQFAVFSPAMAHWELMRAVEVSRGQSLQPEVWSCHSALLFVDISGFTNLCTRLGVDALQLHINRYFTKMISIIMRRGGDVLRFAGDAILCAWSTHDSSTLHFAAHAACACALELLEACSNYSVPDAGTALSIHCGLGASLVNYFRVGSPDRWEFVVAGGALLQVSAAEEEAMVNEAVCSPELWALVKGMCEGASRGDDGCILLSRCLEDPGEPKGDALSAFFIFELVRALKARESQFLFYKERHWRPLSGYVHATARRAIQADTLNLLAEKRTIACVFSKVTGLDDALLDGMGGLRKVQQCVQATQRVIGDHGGELRQFILDDKGAVLIWTFGLPKATFTDNGRRALISALSVNSELRKQGLGTTMGVTMGEAFCGCVGAGSRCEYSVMGPSVNLAARLMCACSTKGAEVLCNHEVSRPP